MKIDEEHEDITECDAWSKQGSFVLVVQHQVDVAQK
jgi:hypothetical protein